MQTLSLQSRAGADGVLHLAIPVEQANQEYEVTVIMRAKTELPFQVHPGWPPGYIEATAGSITDESFFRHFEEQAKKPMQER